MRKYKLYGKIPCIIEQENHNTYLLSFPRGTGISGNVTILKENVREV